MCGALGRLVLTLFSPMSKSRDNTSHSAVLWKDFSLLSYLGGYRDGSSMAEESRCILVRSPKNYGISSPTVFFFIF